MPLVFPFKSITAFISLPLIFSLGIRTAPVGAQSTPEEPPLTASLGQALRRILGDDEQYDPPTTSRDDICLIAPVSFSEEDTIWHQQPVFVWRGAIGKIDVIDVATQASVWEYIPIQEESTTVRTTVYNGTPLQSGRRYQWRIYGATDLSSPLAFQPFAVASRPNRWLINNGLAVAASQTDGEEQSIVIAHINYFVNRSLPTDAIQVLFSTDSASPEILQGQTEVIETLCQF